MEAKDIVKWSILGFLTLYLLTGLSLIIFAVTVPTPFGDYLTMKGAAFPISYVIRIIFLLLILIITALCFYAVRKENNQLLTVFAVLLIILFLVEFIIAIIYFTLTSEINLNEDKFNDGMQMMAAYGMDKKITEAFDRIQRTYACCGLTDYRDWFTSKWDAAQGVDNRVPTSCCKFPSPNCGHDMNTKNPIDVINILGCRNLAGLNYSYDNRMKVVGGVGLAIGFLHLFALLCCIVFCFCFNTVRGLSPVDAIKGGSPLDKPSSGRRGSSALTTPRPSRRHALHASKEKLHEDDEDDDVPPHAYKDLRDKSKT